MNQSLKEFKNSYLESLLSFLWRQWCALGVAGYARSGDTWLIDPEALLLFTCTMGRYEARLFDEVLDWLDINGSFINIQRLRNMLAKKLFHGEMVLSAIAALMAKRNKFAKWEKLAKQKQSLKYDENLFIQKNGKSIGVYGVAEKTFQQYGLNRGKIEFRGHTQPVPIIRNTGLLFKLRALVGINARCEILAYLLTHESAHPSRIAKETYYSQKTVQDILVEMTYSGLVFVRPVGKEKHYWIKTDEWYNFFALNAGIPVQSHTGSPLLDESKTTFIPAELYQKAKWITWPLLLSAFEQIWMKVEQMETKVEKPLVQSSQLRALMLRVGPMIQTAGFSQAITDDKHYLGEEYIPVFFSDINKLLG